MNRHHNPRPSRYSELATDMAYQARTALLVELITLSSLVEPIAMHYTPKLYNGLALIAEFNVNCMAIAFPVMMGAAAGDVAFSKATGKPVLDEEEPTAGRALIQALGGVAAYGAAKWTFGF
jgi:hypothetical protein